MLDLHKNGGRYGKTSPSVQILRLPHWPIVLATVPKYPVCPVGGGNSIKHIVSIFVSDALSILVQMINSVLFGSPGSIRIQRPDWHHDMKMWILYSITFWVMNTKIHGHPIPHKILEKKRSGNLKIFLKGQFILKGNIEGISQLCIVTTLCFSTAFQSVCRSA